MRTNEALIYRPKNRKLIWIAFACAVTIHLAALGLANSKPQSFSPDVSAFGPDVDVTGDLPPANPNEPEIILPPEQTLPNDEFADENTVQRQKPLHKTATAAIPRSTSLGMARATGAGSAKALALFAPRPSYPYEARRGGITGSGVAHLIVNSAGGNVTDARMSQTTGSAILDNATLTALRRWRFKVGVPENVDVPITYTLTGVSY